MSAIPASAPGQAATPDRPASVLTSVSQVRQLNLDAAASRMPIRLQGIITYYDPAYQMAFIQDETGGLYFKEASPDSTATPISFGDLVELNGFTKAGKFSPSIAGTEGRPVTLRRLGTAPLPKPARPPLNRLLDPSLHDQWVEISAVLTSMATAPKRIILYLNSGGLQFEGTLPVSTDSTSIPATWLFKELRLRGVYSALFNQRGQLFGFELFIQSAKQIEVAVGDAAQLFTGEAVSVPDLMRFKEGTKERVRVQGIVLLQIPGVSLYLRGEDNGLLVQTTTQVRLQPGQAVEVVGSPSPGEFCPFLREAIVRAGELGPAPEPLDLVPEQALSAEQDAELVRIEAQLTDVLGGADDRLILLHAGKLAFKARLLSLVKSNAWPELIPGSWLELTGVCSLNAGDDWTPIDPAKPNLRQRLPASFTLLVGGPADLKVLHLPSWWTIRRVTWLASGAGILALLGFVWVALLRHEVGKQTSLLTASIQRESVREERSRIARDLHDTLEQNLTGIMMQTNSARKRLTVAPDRAAEALELVGNMARHSLEEVHCTVWNLRNAQLDEVELGDAVRELLASFGLPDQPKVRLVLSATACRPPGVILNHLLNFIREAVTNAIRHAAANNIDVQIASNHQLLVVEIADDGKGFDTTKADGPNTHHFGLHGMRERALKIKAQYQITSTPGRGTTVKLTLPLSEDASSGKPA